MNRRRCCGAILFVAVLAGCSGSKTPSASAPPAQTGLPLTLVRDVPLPGDTSRLDYQDIDAGRHRLYITHLGDGTVHVVDLDSLSVVTTISDVGSAHGIRVAPDLGRVFASASSTNEAVTIDENTLQIVARAGTGTTPDGIGYDPHHSKIYVSNEHDTAETVIDARTGARVGTIDIGGEAGNTAYDTATGHILVNVQTRNQIAVIDPATDRIIDRIDVTDCDSNHGLYLDAASRLAFVACEGDAQLLVLDLDTKALVARFSTGANPDVLDFDYGLNRLYVASESGIISVFDVDDKTVTKTAEAKLADGAHTVAVDQTTHNVYFPLENIDGRPTLRVMTPSPPARTRGTKP